MRLWGILFFLVSLVSLFALFHLFHKGVELGDLSLLTARRAIRKRLHLTPIKLEHTVPGARIALEDLYRPGVPLFSHADHHAVQIKIEKHGTVIAVDLEIERWPGMAPTCSYLHRYARLDPHVRRPGQTFPVATDLDAEEFRTAHNANLRHRHARSVSHRDFPFPHPSDQTIHMDCDRGLHFPNPTDVAAQTIQIDVETGDEDRLR